MLLDRSRQAWGQQISYFELCPPLRLCSPWFSTLTALREKNKENPQDLSHSDQRKKIDLFALENPKERQCSLFIFFSPNVITQESISGGRRQGWALRPLTGPPFHPWENQESMFLRQSLAGNTGISILLQSILCPGFLFVFNLAKPVFRSHHQ